MTEKTSPTDKRLHIQVMRHFVKQGKKMHAHIKKHHKKYLLGWTIYGVSHLVILHILGLKLLLVKVVVGIGVLVGIANPSLTDLFANMDNICIDNIPVIAQQSCERNFATIQDAVDYLETTVNPETDNIYNAQYYGVVKSLLSNYCSGQIDTSETTNETKKINSISKHKDINKRLALWKEENSKWKAMSGKNNFTGEQQYCGQKFLSYAMMELTQKLFLKELKKRGMLTPRPILSGQKFIRKSDTLLLANFSQRKETNNELDIHSTVADLGSTPANAMANIIKNISVHAATDAIDRLHDLTLLTEEEKESIKDKIDFNFISSCGKNVGQHKIKQYYDDNNILQNTTLEGIQLNVSLCDSYQYIDQLDIQIKRLLIHEIGHYMYYLKDGSVDSFTSICWKSVGNKKRNICNSDEFVSSYAKTNAEEDYAETFSRRALSKINNVASYLSYKRWDVIESDDTASVHATASELQTAISRKFTYFDDLL